MAILSVIESSDSDIILIKYSLINETFLNIKVYPSPVNVATGIPILSPSNTSHSSQSGVTGTFTATISIKQLTNIGVPWEGVQVFELNTVSSGASTKSYGAILLGKVIDCCIADKMYTAVDCDCTDDKCNESLIDAQKMFLFKRSAEFVLKSLSNSEGPSSLILQAAVQDAENKYRKSVELCSNGCGCGNSSSVNSGSGSY